MDPSMHPVFDKFLWKQAMLRDDEMNDDEYFDFMARIAPTIECLDIWNVIIKPHYDVYRRERVERILNFPQLKKLEIGLVSSNFLQPFHPDDEEMLRIFHGNNPKLRELKVSRTKDFWRVDVLPSELNKILRINNRIVILKLDILERNFIKDLEPNPGLKLKSLTTAFPQDSSDIANLEKFLIVQTCLEDITLSSVMAWKPFCEVMRKMTSCKFLTIQEPALRKPKGEILPQILEFKITTNYKRLPALLLSMPNLKVLSVLNINKDIVSFASRNLKSLELIKYAGIQEDFVAYYDKLKRKQLSVNKNIKFQKQSVHDFLEPNDKKYLMERF